MGQSALSQSDCRIFKSTIFSEQVEEIPWFLACLYKLLNVKSWYLLGGLGHIFTKNVPETV